MKKNLKIIAVTLLVILLLPVAFLVVTQGWYYASYPIYDFREPVPFHGDNYYNPYAGAVPGDWKKCVFHAHGKSWGGFTDGASDVQHVIDVYRQLGFDVTAISNYMQVDTTGHREPSYIPCYEHGYGYGKTHQLAMGSDGHVLWRDYIFIQGSLSQKQYTIDLMRKHCEVLVLNHPDLRYGYTPEDFKYLCNYDLMETFNGARLSMKYWDSAFTHGHTAWVTGNDDSHGVDDLGDIQREVVFVNSPSVHRPDILSAIARGTAYVVSFPRDTFPTMERKLDMAAKVSYPAAVTMSGDTLQVRWSRTMATITFVGDSGKVLSTVENSDYAAYVLRPADTYVRTVLSDGELTYSLNPVVRSVDGQMPPKQQLASVNGLKTAGKYSTIILSLALVAGGVVWLRRKLCRRVISSQSV